MRVLLMRSVVCLLITAVTGSPTTLAQTPAASPTISVNAELVSVPVVVTDSQGRHVHGLAASDFQIFENGHPQVIRSFEATAANDSATPTNHAAPASLAGSFHTSSLTAVILFFDQVNTPASEQAEVRRLLANYYRGRQGLTPPTCVVLYTGSELRLIAQPTNDPAKIASAIAQMQTTITSHGAGVSGELPLPEGARENQVVGDAKLEQGRAVERYGYYNGRSLRATDTTQALSSIARLFAPWLGEKVILWISAGTTEPIPTAELQAVQIKVYPLNVHAHIPYMFISSFTLPTSTYEYETAVNMQLLQNLRYAAQETGGRLCNNALDAAACVRSAEQDGSDFYLLTYATHSRQRQPEWRTIKVTVQRPGSTVFARTGVLIQPRSDPVQEKRRQIQEALLGPIEFSALRVTASLHVLDKHRSAATVSLVMGWDAQRPPVWSDSAVDFTVAGVVLQGFQVVQRFGEDVRGPLPSAVERRLQSEGLAWSRQINLPVGNGTLRIVVRDNNTGRLASITEPLPPHLTNEN